MPPVYVFVAPVSVDEGEVVGEGVAVVVCVVVLVTGSPPPEGVTVMMTVTTRVVGVMDTEAVEVMVVSVGVMTETVLATHPTEAHANPAMQHPPPRLAGQAVAPSVHAPTVTPQFWPLGQHPTFPDSGALVTTKHVVPVVQQ